MGPKAQTCPICGGDGEVLYVNVYDEVTSKQDCRLCHGTGWIMVNNKCPDCDGSGINPGSMDSAAACATCEGTGYLDKVKYDSLPDPSDLVELLDRLDKPTLREEPMEQDLITKFTVDIETTSVGDIDHRRDMQALTMLRAMRLAFGDNATVSEAGDIITTTDDRTVTRTPDPSKAASPAPVGPELVVIPSTVAAHVLWQFGDREKGMEPGSFTTFLLAAMTNADQSNLGRLRSGFPEYAAAFELAARRDDGMEHLRRIA